MEVINEIDIETPQPKTFTSHVLNFDDNTKNTLFNIAQYVVLAIIPIVILNKSIQSLFDEPNESKSNLEILTEVVLQLLIIFTSLVFIHRTISYIPTFSKTSYPEINSFSTILPILVILLSLQTKVGQKTNILFERLKDYYYGTPTSVPTPKKTDPTMLPPTLPTRPEQPMPDYITSNQLLTDDHMPGQIPHATTQNIHSISGSHNTSSNQSQQPNFNQMFQHNNGNMGTTSINNIEPFSMGGNSIGGAPF
uniref:Transmembrane protein n=1 Tax=viral metagenome TaxID=1070528 RepID=A0A6C0KJH4_9ZZZZ